VTNLRKYRLLNANTSHLAAYLRGNYGAYRSGAVESPLGLIPRATRRTLFQYSRGVVVLVPRKTDQTAAQTGS
jgi:hypothetical protein